MLEVSSSLLLQLFKMFSGDVMASFHAFSPFSGHQSRPSKWRWTLAPLRQSSNFVEASEKMRSNLVSEPIFIDFSSVLHRFSRFFIDFSSIFSRLSSTFERLRQLGGLQRLLGAPEPLQLLALQLLTLI